MPHSRQEDVQALAVAVATAHVGKLRAAQAVAFAKRQQLHILHYNSAMDSWQLSDGEIYTTSAIVLDNAKEWDDAI